MSAQPTHHLTMAGMGEHIDGGKALGAVAFMGEEGKVTGHGLGVTADIDHPFRGHPDDALDELRGRAFPGWVHKNHVGTLSGVGGFPDPCGSVGGKEPGIFDAVVLGVADGVMDGIPVDLDADDLLRLAGGGQADGADAAVGVQNRFLTGQLGGINGEAVENGGLDGVDLIETAWADGVALAAEGVQNKSLAVQHFFVFAEDNAGLARVVVLHDGGDGNLLLFGFGEKGADEVLCARQDGLSRHQNHHDLTGRDAPAEQAVPEQAGAFVLVEGLVAASVGGGTDGLHHGVKHLVLQQAAVHRKHLVGLGGVDAGSEFSTVTGRKCGDHLVPVVVGRFHTADGVDGAVFAEQFADIGFLPLELFGIFKVEQRTAAAVFRA